MVFLSDCERMTGHSEVIDMPDKFRVADHLEGSGISLAIALGNPTTGQVRNTGE
jgi:hypothetical protein